MRKMAALMGALLLTLVLAAPAAANQKVLIEEESGPCVFPPDGPVTVNKDDEILEEPVVLRCELGLPRQGHLLPGQW